MRIRTHIIQLFFVFIVFSSCSVEKNDEIQFTFNSSYDGSLQKASGLAANTEGIHPKPLLVIAHYWGGNRFTARDIGFYNACRKRGWHAVSPELHGKNTGGKTALASLGAQHDILDVIDYMKQNYQIDETRIYLAGRSMGGMLAQMMAAKYPNMFAGVVAGMGISDLKSWIDQYPEIKDEVEKECGRYSEQSFEYERRSSINYAENLAYVPLVLWHGTNDRIVSPEQTQSLYDKIKKHNPYQYDIQWLQGAPHKATNFSPEWVLEQLKFHRNISDNGIHFVGRFFDHLKFTTDEKGRFFWITIIPLDDQHFSSVNAQISESMIKVESKNTRRIIIHFDKIPQDYAISRYSIQSDGQVKLIFKNKERIISESIIDRASSGSLKRQN